VNRLALDLGTRTGWALLEHGRIESGVSTFDVPKGSSEGVRYLKFNRWLNDMALDLELRGGRPRVSLIVFEQAHHRGGAATAIGLGFTTRVVEFCAVHGIDHVSVNSNTLKAWVLGAAPPRKKTDPLFDRSKAAMVRTVNRRWPDKLITDDNEADALALLRYAMEHYADDRGPDAPSPTTGSRPPDRVA
jgi:hypothetical protein